MSGGDYQGAQMSKELKYNKFIERLETLYEAGDVKRMHTIPTVRHHTIAEHVYGSLLIARELVLLNSHAASWGPVATTLLYHDAPELETGDIPAPVKRANIDIDDALEKMELNFAKTVGYINPTLTPTEAAIVKASDTLDLMWKCVLELRMGNQHMRLGVVFRNVANYIQAQVHIAGVEDIVNHLRDQWRRDGGV